MTRLILVGLGSLVFLLSSSAVLADEDSTRALQSAHGLLRRGLHDLAADEYRTAMRGELTPSDRDMARYGLGVCLYRTGSYDNAIKALDGIDAESFAFGADALLIRGHCRLALEQPAEAASHFENVVRSHGEHATADHAASLWIESLHAAGDWAAVDTAMTLMRDRWPDSSHLGRATLLWSLAAIEASDDRSALSRLGVAMEANRRGPLASRVLLETAGAHHRLGSLELASEVYTSLIDDADAPTQWEAILGFAHVRYDLGDRAGASKAVRRYLGRDDEEVSDRAGALLLGARLSLDGGDTDAAREQLKDVKRDEGGDRLAADVVLIESMCDLRDEKPARASKRLERALERYPKSPLRGHMMYERANALAALGEPAAAVTQVESLLKLDAARDLHPFAMYLAGVVEHQREAYGSATTWCDRVRDEHADHDVATDARVLAAESMFLAGDYDAAMRRFGRLVEDGVGDEERQAVCRYRLGVTLQRVGNFAEARPHLEAVASGASRRSGDARLALGRGLFDAGRWSDAERTLGQWLAAQGDDADARDEAMLKLGLSLARQGNHRGAIDAFDALIDRRVESDHRTHAMFERGQSLMETGEEKAASDAFEAVLKRSDGERFAMHARRRLGALARSRGDLDAAARWLQGASSDPQAMFDRGCVLLESGAFDEAEGVFADLAQSEESDASQFRQDATAYRLVARSRQGKHAEVVAEGMRLLRGSDARDLDPKVAVSLRYEIAWCMRELDREAEAYELLLAIESAAAGTLASHVQLELGSIEMAQDRLDDASERLERLLLSMDEGASDASDLGDRATYRLAICRYRAGDLESAGTLLSEFDARFPKSSLRMDAAYLRGECLYHLGSFDDAGALFERVIDGDGVKEADRRVSLLRVGECALVLQRWARAEGAFSRFLNDHKDDPLWFQAEFGVGWARENMGRRDEAMASYRRVVAGHDGPTAARAQFQIGECLYADRRYEDAVRELLRVDILYDIPEWSAAALYEAGRCFEELGRSSEAMQQFRRVVEGFGETKWSDLARGRLDALSPGAIPGRE